MNSDDELIDKMCAAWLAAPLPPEGSSFAESDRIAMRAVLAVVRAHDGDAERYRWLRDRWFIAGEQFPEELFNGADSPDHFDDAIDAARGK